MSSRHTAELTFSFTGFARRGGQTADHADGWGIAFYEPGGCRVFHDVQPASVSPLARFVCEHPIKAHIALSHVRKATQGEVAVANCHPFQREWGGQTWVFATNGDLRDFSPPLRGPYLPVGSTDSEKAFCWLMQSLHERFGSRPPVWMDLAPCLAELVAEVARHGNFNLLLSQGEVLFAHCSSTLYRLQRQHPFSGANLVDCELSVDLSRVNCPEDRMLIVATEPLTRDEPWTAFQTGELVVLERGALVWQHIHAGTRRFPVPVPFQGSAQYSTAG